MLFLILVTFFYPREDTSDQFQVPESFWNLEVTQISGTGWVSAYPISPYDVMYSQNKNFSVLDTGTIQIQQWQFLIDVRDATQKYSVSHQYFDVNFVGFWEVFIDTTDPKNFTVLSLNNTLSLSLKDGAENSEKVTDVYLYPHMYIKFNPSRNKFLKNADLVRVSSVFSLDYFAPPVFYGEVTDNFGTVFQEVMAYQKEQIPQENKQLQKLDSLSSYNFPGSDMIDTYFNIFVNQTKKDMYYKNKAFNNLITLSQTYKRDQDLVSTTLESIELLKKSPENYKDIRETLDYMYNTILYSPSENMIYVKVNFTDLVGKINGEEVPTDSNFFLSSFFLDSLYSTFDISGDFSYSSLLWFFNEYIQELGVDIKEQTGFTQNNRAYLEYLWFFVENIIISRFETSAEQQDSSDLLDGNNLSDILRVMEWYITLSSIVYWNGGQTEAITLIYEYIDVLESVSDFLHYTFFEPERDKNGLLVRKTGASISNKNLTLLKKNITQIFDFYTQNNSYLDTSKQRDKFIARTYNSSMKEIPEYLFALENYENYVYTYDESKKNLLDLDTWILSNTKKTLSQDDFLSYMSQFKWVSVDGSQVEVFENYYRVSWVIINGTKFSFDMYPFSDYKIQNINMNDQKINGSYKLEVIKDDWKERSSWLSSEQREKYDFALFFTNTFFSEDDRERELFEVETQTGNEDKVIVVFKRDRLLWKKWEFSSLSDILKIDFNDVEVTPKGETYSISIENAELILNSVDEQGRTTPFDAKFTSDYLLTSDKHQFRNIYLRPELITVNQRIFQLWDNSIKVIGSINLSDFRSEMQEIANIYPVIKYVYNFIERELWVSQLDIQYKVYNKKSTIKFDYNGKQVIITLWGNDIESVTYAGKTISQQGSTYRDIESIFETIK